jgi:4-amino-4-deoxy-L-arabinose transferase-like glycosyltransferase
MQGKINSNLTERVFLFIVVASASFLLFWNLGNQYLWQDEAQTALISKTILTHGIPRGYDGKNFFSQELGINYGENYVWKWHPWLPFYMLAGFFKMFGTTTLVARLPFALLGLATVFLTYYFSKSLWNDRRVGAAAAIVLLLSVPFLILTKQCRYYSPAIFFSVLGLYGYMNLVENKRYGALTFFLSSMFLFHTFFIYCATLLAATSVHALLFYRNRLQKVLLLWAGVILANLPWIIWFSTAEYGRATELDFDADRFVKFTLLYLGEIWKYVFHPFLLIVPLLIAEFNRRKGKAIFSMDLGVWKNLLLLLLFAVFNLIVASWFSHVPYFRYLAPIIPVLCMIIAFILVSAMDLHLVVGVVTWAVVVLSSLLPDYLYEITHDYDGPIEGIVKHLNRNGSGDDTVAITYGDLPLKFYTDMRVVGGLTGEDLSPSKEADWIILRKHLRSIKASRVKNYLIQNVPWGNYQKITIDYPDIPFENRESPIEHRYRTVKDADRVVIYKRVR